MCENLMFELRTNVILKFALLQAIVRRDFWTNFDDTANHKFPFEMGQEFVVLVVYSDDFQLVLEEAFKLFLKGLNTSSKGQSMPNPISILKMTY